MRLVNKLCHQATSLTTFRRLGISVPAALISISSTSSVSRSTPFSFHHRDQTFRFSSHLTWARTTAELNAMTKTTMVDNGIEERSKDGHGGRVWFITGTSSGFGRRLVTSVLSRGDRVIATARTPEKASSVISNCPPHLRDNLRTIELDVTEGEQSLKSKVKHATTFWEGAGIDVLVNNAGFGLPGLIEEGGTALLRRQFETNVFGFLDVTNAVLPHMRAKRSGTVVVIGSRSAYKTEVPGLGMYAASKAAVHALTETLAVELLPFNIRVLLVAPGAFRTEGIYGQPFHTTNPIPDYDHHRHISHTRFKSVPGTEKGDPGKAMEAVVDIVRGEGAAAGRPWPTLLLLGDDACSDFREKTIRTSTAAKEWKDVSRGVNFDL